MIILNLLELAPYENSDSHDLSGIKDLKMLWNKVSEIKKTHNYVTPSEIYPLKASVKKLESSEDNNSFYHYSSGNNNSFALKSTGAIIGEIAVIRQILNQLQER